MKKLNRSSVSRAIVGLAPVVSVCVFAPAAAAQVRSWMVDFGSNALRDNAWAVTPDGQGGVFMTGDTHDELGTTTSGWSDGYIAHFDGEGTMYWATVFQSNGHDNSRAVAVDGRGGVFVAGRTDGEMGGPNAGGSDVFLALFDENGDMVWVRQFGSRNDETVYSLLSDGAGGVFIAGDSRFPLTPGWAGSWDGFLARYDHDGNQTWLRQFGSPSADHVYAITTDGTGGCYISGYTRGDYGGPHVGANTFPDAYVARFSASGEELWVRLLGTEVEDYARAAASDGMGGVYIGGWTYGDLGGPNAGRRDAWVAHYDSTGNRLWSDQFGTDNDDNVRTLLHDGAGGVYVGGDTRGVLSGPGPAPSQSDVFVARFSRSGQQVWIDQFSGGGSDYARGLAPDGNNGFFVGGTLDDGLRGNAFLARYRVDQCYADCDETTGFSILDIFDFLCFQNAFVTSDPYACDCDTTTGQGVCDIFDFLCFQNAFVAGCP